jgi:hypothetical protein
VKHPDNYPQLEQNQQHHNSAPAEQHPENAVFASLDYKVFIDG